MLRWWSHYVCPLSTILADYKVWLLSPETCPNHRVEGFPSATILGRDASGKGDVSHAQPEQTYHSDLAMRMPSYFTSHYPSSWQPSRLKMLRTRRSASLRATRLRGTALTLPTSHPYFSQPSTHPKASGGALGSTPCSAASAAHSSRVI